MKKRTGKECKKVSCKNFVCYSNWANSLSAAELKVCMNCKHAHVSQYEETRIKKAGGERQKEE
jgi:hypothetical protein